MVSLAESAAYCRNVARTRARNFYYSFVLLSPAQRDAMFALYAFMRYCDDLSDEPAAPRHAIEHWRTALDHALGGQCDEHPVWPAFHHAVRTYNIPHQYFHEMIDGVQADLEPRRMQTFSELRHYCYQVASCVGLAVIHIFGFDDPQALILAEKTGIAFQLTNVIRDVREDAERGRVYIPIEDINRFQADLLRYDERFIALMTYEAKRAHDYFNEAAPVLDMVHSRSRSSFWALFEIYRRLLNRIERAQFQVLDQRVKLGAWEKISIVLRAPFTHRSPATRDTHQHSAGTEQRATTTAEPDTVALAVIDSKIRLVTVAEDGQYQLLDPTSKLHKILYAWTAEVQALQAAIDELETLINNPTTKEADLQHFFEQHPTFLTSDEYKKAHPRIVLSRHDAEPLKPDFLLEPLDQRRLCDILDLKLPTAQIIVTKQRRQRFSAAVYEACAQLREYHLYFDDPKNRETIKQHYGLLAYKPRMLVIIGRLGNVDPLALRTYELDTPQLSVRTYDDILARIKERYVAIKHGGRRNRSFFR
jgi:phytoene synthase